MSTQLDRLDAAWRIWSLILSGCSSQAPSIPRLVHKRRDKGIHPARPGGPRRSAMAAEPDEPLIEAEGLIRNSAKKFKSNDAVGWLRNESA